MLITGTSKAMDIWWNINMVKSIANEPMSDKVKNLLVEMYDEYKKAGGKQKDVELENLKKEE